MKVRLNGKTLKYTLSYTQDGLFKPLKNGKLTLEIDVTEEELRELQPLLGCYNCIHCYDIIIKERVPTKGLMIW